MLAAARANRVTMFGDIGDRVSPTYFTGPAVSLQRHTFTEDGEDNDADVDPTGRRIVFSSTRHNANPDLYIKSVEGVAVTQLTGDPASDTQPAFSPDGLRVAFASDRGGQWDIWIISTDSGQPIRVTDSPADEVHPSWSPDGQQLVFCSLPAEGGQWELWITQARSGASRKFIGYGLFPEWSPSSDTIVYQRARERGTRRFSIWTLTLVDGEPRYPTELAANARDAFTLPTWSSDASHIAFASVVDRPSDAPTDAAPAVTTSIWLMSADGRSKVRLTDGHAIGFAPTFSLDGRVFFTSNRSGADNVWSLLPSGEAIRAIDVEVVTAASLQSLEAEVIGDRASAGEASPPGGL
jgi:TolB protein